MKEKCKECQFEESHSQARSLYENRPAPTPTNTSKDWEAEFDERFIVRGGYLNHHETDNCKLFISTLLDSQRKEMVECLPEKEAINKYVERNDVRGLASYVKASIEDLINNK